MIKKIVTILILFGLGLTALTLWAEKTKLNDAYATTCFKTGERISGMNKICYYNCLGSEAAITISSVALCPLTIEN